MNIQTTRFGKITVAPDEQIRFPAGLIGFEDCHDWVLLRDSINDNVVWLQSIDDPALAVAAVGPRHFVPEYQIRVAGQELSPLGLNANSRLITLSLLSKQKTQLTINLKAPLLINWDRHLGRQIITSDEQPLQLALPSVPVNFRRSA